MKSLRSWLIDCKGIATKVKNAGLSPANQIKDCGANRECPNCHSRIDNTDVANEWPGLPAGVKFDPSDVEILEHLEAKCGVGSVKPHMFIDEFIPTVNKQEGICYTHPEYLPGAKKDGSSVHFFHRTTNAYATGQRKRRKIHNQHSLILIKEDVRWHKTGKTRSVMENGVKKGYKKIMVLYTISKKGSKPEKSNWVMHQYHLGTNEDELEGHYVVSKIFYQQQKQSDNECSQVVEQSDMGTIQTIPRTPNKNTLPPRWEKSVLNDDVTEDSAPKEQQAEFFGQTSLPSSSAAPQFKDDTDTQCWLAGESQAVEGNDADESLLCDEIFGSYPGLDDPALNDGPFSAFARITDDLPGVNGNEYCGVADLENLELDTAPDNLPDLQFGSQDSIYGWLDPL